MNGVISDNRVSTMQHYLSGSLQSRYDERESSVIAAQLFRHIKNWNRAEMIMHASAALGESELLKFHFALKRLLAGEPLQYVLGHTYFYGLYFELSPEVLIPRPETEELVDEILKSRHISAPKVLDIGTGSGCIAVSIAKKWPDARVVAVDISSGALEIARKNAAHNHVQIEFRELNILKEGLGNQRFDIIVSNPPYVLESDKQEMTESVLQFEPHTALFVPDNDPLLFYRKIFELCEQHLEYKGILYCEIHERMSDNLLELASQFNWSEVQLKQDMQGKMRMLIAIK